MATRKTNGRDDTAHGARGSTRELVAAQAEQVAPTAGAIARITDEVAEGADTQVRSLDAPSSGSTRWRRR